MQKGRAAGAHACNGYAMWLGQAEKIGRYGKKSKKAKNQRVKAKSKKIPEKYVGAFFF